MTIQRNHIEACEGNTALYVKSGVFGDILLNTFVANKVAPSQAVVFLDALTATDTKLSVNYNSFMRNEGSVILHVSGGTSPEPHEFWGNVFAGNQVTNLGFATTFLLEGAYNSLIRFNLFTDAFVFHNLRMGLDCDCDTVVQAQGNWWGSLDEAKIDVLIYDGADELALPLVNYSGYQLEGSLPCATVSNCSNHGRCVEPERCGCDSGWDGDICDQPSCEDVGGCNGAAGQCVGPNVCQCENDWKPPFCNEAVCEGSCSGNGFCGSPNKCRSVLCGHWAATFRVRLFCPHNTHTYTRASLQLFHGF